MALPTINEWQYYDKNGNIMPWFSGGFLDELIKWDVSNWTVFEYGSGWSTIWWAKNAKQVISIDHNQEWVEDIRSYLSQNNINNASINLYTHDKYVESIDNFDMQFDCIVVDGLYREKCLDKACARIKYDGIVINDDSERNLDSFNKPRLQNLAIKHNECHTFTQEGASEWTTSYWKIKQRYFIEPKLQEETEKRKNLILQNPKLQYKMR